MVSLGLTVKIGTIDGIKVTARVIVRSGSELCSWGWRLGWVVVTSRSFGQVDPQPGSLSHPGTSPGCGVSGPTNSGHHGVNDPWGPQEPSSISEA